MSFTPMTKEQLLEQYKDTMRMVARKGTAVSAADLYYLINLDMELTRLGLDPVATLAESRTAKV